jgi:hypothetical protein
MSMKVQPGILNLDPRLAWAWFWRGDGLQPQHLTRTRFLNLNCLHRAGHDNIPLWLK